MWDKSRSMSMTAHSRHSYYPKSYQNVTFPALKLSPQRHSRTAAMVTLMQLLWQLRLQRCVRETASSVTRFINAFDDVHGRRSDDDASRQLTAKLWHRASDDCTVMADRALPPLIEAIRATITRPTSVNALIQLINTASDAVRVR